MSQEVEKKREESGNPDDSSIHSTREAGPTGHKHESPKAKPKRFDALG